MQIAQRNLRMKESNNIINLTKRKEVWGQFPGIGNGNRELEWRSGDLEAEISGKIVLFFGIAK